MTEQELEKLAEMVADKLWDKQMQLETEAEQNTEKIGEMAKLETMLSVFEQTEEYAKAYETKQRLEKLKAELIESGVLKPGE